MVSFFNRKKKSDENEDEQHDTNSEQGAASTTGNQQPIIIQSSGDEPNERTRLLQQHQVPGYLSPDDPAVTPYNLWSVRALRALEVMFLGITFLWFALLFVCIFISPPGMHSRGSGYTDVAFTTLTIGNIMVALMFFSVPSAAMGVLSATATVLILVDMILVVAIARLREEEGWTGIASVVWAVFIGLFIVIANRTVKWGKAEEEERLTGRQETKRSVKEWFAVLLVTIIMVIFVLISVLLTATLSLRARDVTITAPGNRYSVDSGKYEVHIACYGNATYDSSGSQNPTVLVEGGYMPVGGSFDGFMRGAYTNGTIGRYCYWDRPGMAFSDNAPSPHSAGMSADVLDEILAEEGETGPYILVSSGIGGIYSRIFASRNGGKVKGMLFIDVLSEDLLSQVAASGRGFLLWGRGMISPLGIDRLLGAIFKGRSREDRVFGVSSNQGGRFLKAKLQEHLVAVSLTKSEMKTANRLQDRTVPLVVFSSGSHIKADSSWNASQASLTNVTDNLLAWEVIEGSLPSKARYDELWKLPNGAASIEKGLGMLFSGTPTTATPSASATPSTSSTPSTPTSSSAPTTPSESSTPGGSPGGNIGSPAPENGGARTELLH